MSTPPDESLTVARQESKKIKFSTRMYRLVYGEVTSYHLFFRNHLGFQKIGIITHVLLMDDLAPHRQVVHIFYLSPFYLVNIVVASIPIYGLYFRWLVTLYHAGKMIPFIADLHQILMVSIEL